MKKIFIIDDESSVCELLEQFLKKEGYAVKSETDSGKALALIKKTKPDLIMLDIKMPKMDGIDLLSLIKKDSPDTSVIMITGYGSLESAVEAMKLGASEYITKPFDLSFVKEAIKTVLNGE